MKVIREWGDSNGSKSAIISAGTGVFYVDTRNTFDVGWETMVFPFDLKENTAAFDIVKHERRYDSLEEAMKGHDEIVENIEKYTSRTSLLRDFVSPLQ